MPSATACPARGFDSHVPRVFSPFPRHFQPNGLDSRTSRPLRPRSQLSSASPLDLHHVGFDSHPRRRSQPPEKPLPHSSSTQVMLPSGPIPISPKRHLPPRKPRRDLAVTSESNPARKSAKSPKLAAGDGGGAHGGNGGRARRVSTEVTTEVTGPGSRDLRRLGAWGCAE